MNAPAGIQQLQDLVLRIINLSVGFAFIVLTLALIYGGFKYLTSGGDQKALPAAKQTITYGIIGIVLMALAWIILLLIEAFTGIEVTKFNLCVLFENGKCPPI